MTRRPSMQFYPADFLGGTTLLSRAAVGAYITMLCHAWETGPIADTRAARFKAMGLGPDESLDELWAEVKSKWTLTPAGWVNARLERTRAERDAFIEKQRANGRHGGRPSVKQNPNGKPNETQAKPNSSADQIPNGNPNENSPSPISDLRPCDPSPTPDPTSRTARAPKNYARVPHCHDREVDERACKRGLCLSSYQRGQFQGQSGKGAAAPAFVDGFLEWVIGEVCDQTLGVDPMQFLRRAWEIYVKEGAYREGGHPQDWYAECEREHGGRCGSEYKHSQFTKDAASA